MATLGETTRERTPPPAAGLFASTRWTVVLAASAAVNDGGPEDGVAGPSAERASRALAELCRVYWRPLYRFLRHQGIAPEYAEDLTQGFFAELIESRALARADRAKGRFRSFLLGALKHFVADARDREHTVKRGGGVVLARLDEATLAEVEAQAAVWREDGSAAGSGDHVFDREWAAALLRQAFQRLEEECTLAGRRALFLGLRPHLATSGDGGSPISVPYETLAQTLGRPAATLRSDVARLRARFRAILREEVRDTVVAPDEVDAELQHLCRVLAAN